MASFTVYRIDVAGFTHTARSLRDIAAWVAALKVRHAGIVGSEAVVYEGRQTGDCVTFGGGFPSKRMVVSA